MIDSDALEDARARLHAAQRIVVFSGAGMSAESGVPTFRGSGGLWKQFRPEELATPGAFARDPRLVWEWYDGRRRLILECAPNPGHRAIAEAQVRGSRAGDVARVRVVTQNVDGLHARALEDAGASDAGASEASALMPIELHGSLFRIRCSACPYTEPNTHPLDTSTEDVLPRCPECAALLRPGVVWFGEMLDAAVLSSAHEIAHDCDLCVVVGTSALVEPAASIPRVTQASGGGVIEVNVEPSALTASADVALFGPAGQVLPLLFAD